MHAATQNIASQNVVIVSNGCPNCARFVDALNMSKTATTQVRLVDVSTLSESQLVGISAVPTLILTNGRRLTGTAAFQWLDQFSEEIEPDAFGGFGVLPFSDVSANIGFATFNDSFASIE